MVRTVNKQTGFSIVEVMVSMVIISIVVTLISSVLVTSSKTMGTSKRENSAEMIALQKLAELQNKNAASTSGVVTAASPVIKSSVEYTEKWEINTDKPHLAIVTVEWNGLSGTTESVQVVGYIAIDNSCPVPSTSNHDPGDITFTVQSGVVEVATNEVKLFVGSGAANENGEIVEMATADEDNDDGDNHTYSISSAGQFAIEGDKLITTSELTAEVDYTVDILTTDCNDATKEVTLTIVVRIGGLAPVMSDKTSETIQENSTSGTVTSMSASCADGTIYSTSSSDFDIDASSGAVTVKGSATLNYEDASLTDNEVSVTIRAANAAEPASLYTDVTLTVPLGDVQEIPTNIVFTTTPNPLTIESGVASTTQLATYTVDDPDASTPDHESSVTLKKSGVSKSMDGFSFTTVAPYSISATTGLTSAAYPAGDYEFTIKITDFDVGTTPIYFEKTLAIEITAPVVSGEDCSGLPLYYTWVNGSNATKSYSSGSYLKYEPSPGVFHKYKAIDNTNNYSSIPPSNGRMSYEGVCQ
jgi:prepilin-type N-terminal cleavage/methylation domain-containing protein